MKIFPYILIIFFSVGLFLAFSDAKKVEAAICVWDFTPSCIDDGVASDTSEETEYYWNLTPAPILKEAPAQAVADGAVVDDVWDDF